ncbi:MAG: DNA translocase FtsK, partial [Clostridiales bacterium]|nr:DNA translocase FtsK [Clostridiales bacterium]
MEAAGSVGAFFVKLFKGCFSSAAYILPYYLMVYGLLLLIGKVGFVGKKSALCLIIVYIGIIMVNSVRFYDDITDFSMSMDTVKAMYYQGIEAQGGGLFGGVLATVFIKLFGVPGAYIFSVTIIIISLILLINTPISTLFSKFKIKHSEETDYEENVKIKTPADMLMEAFNNENNTNASNAYNEKQIKIIDYMKDEGLFDKKDINIKTTDNAQKTAASDGQYLDEKKKAISDKPSEEVGELKINIPQDPGMNYKMPSLDLLNKSRIGRNDNERDNLVAKASILEKTLQNFGVNAKVVEVSKGPTVTRFEIQPSPGVKVSSIVRLSDDIALNLEASSIRIEAPIPGKAAVGIEIQNDSTTPVVLREVLECNEFKNDKSKISFGVGKDISGNPVIADLAKMPHLLIAGSTGSGKSVCINGIILSILYKARPDEVKLLLIDPKVVELNVFNGIPHLLIPVVTDPNKSAAALNWAVQEMTNRYKVFAEENVRDIDSYNKKMISE